MIQTSNRETREMPPKAFPRREVHGSIGRTTIRISLLTKKILAGWDITNFSKFFQLSAHTYCESNIWMNAGLF